MDRERKKRARKTAGYTLIEMTISLMIIALVIAMAVMYEDQRDRTDKKTELDHKFDVLGDKLYQSRIANYRLPCPGDSRLAMSDPKFGYEADSDPADEACEAGPTVQSDRNNDDASVVGGDFPVRTAGLPDDAAVDPWGNRILYYVDVRATNPCHWLTSRKTYGYTGSGNLTVEDASGSTINDTIVAVLLSAGPDGHGASNREGIHVNAQSTNAAELENCMCDSTGALVSDHARQIRIQRTVPTDAGDHRTNFDDVGRFYNRNFFYTYAEKQAI